jgi:hypothetical protein
MQVTFNTLTHRKPQNYSTGNLNTDAEAAAAADDEKSN